MFKYFPIITTYVIRSQIIHAREEYIYIYIYGRRWIEGAIDLNRRLFIQDSTEKYQCARDSIFKSYDRESD